MLEDDHKYSFDAITRSPADSVVFKHKAWTRGIMLFFMVEYSTLCIKSGSTDSASCCTETSVVSMAL